MTELKFFILFSLFERGPMLDMDLWQITTEVSMAPVTQSCMELEQSGHIEQPRGIRPVSYEWQLTQKGREFVSNVLAQYKGQGGELCKLS
jgi:DNA-binding HxlR family transcriptional regulator